jgi:acetate kinase
MNVLVFNPGGNSLKAAVVSCQPKEQSSSQASKSLDVIVEGIGKEPRLGLYQGKTIASSEPISGDNFEQAAESILAWLEKRAEADGLDWRLKDIECIGVRVVHGGGRFTTATEITPDVETAIADFAKWAPLHNRRSLEILPALRRRVPQAPIYAVFDTAFHATIPPKAGLYAIPFELSHKYAIYRYGFHGVSHRYLMERYAAIVKKSAEELNLVTMHLESGCSVTAISKGKSVDNTMGLTPLEGLMMGTRSGDIDPSLPAFLAKQENLDIDAVQEMLEKRSGLLGVSGVSLDTRVLMRRYDSDERVRVAMEMFSHRVLKAVGAYLASLGGADAVIFGGGIAENTPLLRQRVCDCLRWCGLDMDPAQNRKLIDIEGRLSTRDSRIQAYVIPAEENLQIAHECCQAIAVTQMQFA